MTCMAAQNAAGVELLLPRIRTSAELNTHRLLCMSRVPEVVNVSLRPRFCMAPSVPGLVAAPAGACRRDPRTHTARSSL